MGPCSNAVSRVSPWSCSCQPNWWDFEEMMDSNENLKKLD